VTWQYAARAQPALGLLAQLGANAGGLRSNRLLSKDCGVSIMCWISDTVDQSSAVVY
jgi:hypothetical protein